MVDVGAFAPACGSIILIDQALKAVLTAALPDGRAVRVGRLGWIRPSRSAGPIATRLGIPAGVLPLVWLAVFASLVLVAPLVGTFESRVSWAAIGLAVGGAGSNVLDRFLRGGVVDYVDLRVWPAFNLADVAIVLGVVGALLAG